MIELGTFIVLLGVIVALLVDRYYFNKSMMKRLDDVTKAALSKDVNEYLAAKNAEEPRKEKFTPQDEIPIELLDDEEFDKFIKTQTNG